MPQDINGHELKRGDTVLVRCRVAAAHKGENGCNLDLRALDCPPGEHRAAFSANSKSVSYVAPDVEETEAPQGPAESMDDE